MDDDSLEQLRWVVEDVNVDTREFNLHTSDMAISDWFDNTTGLIDDIHCAHDLPPNHQDLIPSMVDVVLDASVGLYRSVDLIFDLIVRYFR